MKVNPLEKGLTAQNEILVRLYDGSLDLLDIVTLSVTTAHKKTMARIDGATARLTWGDTGGDLYIDPKTPPRLLSIDVGLVSGYYKLLFKFLTKDGTKVQIPGSSRIAPGDVESLLARVRDFWTQLVITTFSSALTVASPTFAEYLKQLRDFGNEAWQLMFGDRYEAQKGAGETLGELLAELRPNEGAHIQITYSGVIDFIFPWSIVYPPDEGSTIDAFQFWGTRYQIEQVHGGPKSDALDGEPVRVIFALDPSFGNAHLQTEMFQDYTTAANGKLSVSDPVSEQQKLFAGLVDAPSAHMYYFYCHGYAPAGKSILRRDGVKLLREKIEAIPEGSAERAALETLLISTTKMNDEPWIYIGDSEVTESQLKGRDFFKKRRPIVFLNMCQSAELLPSLTGGLVRVFLDHNASAVIGTECPMTSIFANAFSKVVFAELFAGSDVGTALLKARRHFVSKDIRNPLGLAYTLYGRSLARFDSPPIIAAQNN